MDWQTIDTAPTDRPIIIWVSIWKDWFEAKWQGRYWDTGEHSPVYPGEASHWCEPTQPESQEPPSAA